jgi:hypothetical protein
MLKVDLKKIQNKQEMVGQTIPGLSNTLPAELNDVDFSHFGFWRFYCCHYFYCIRLPRNHAKLYTRDTFFDVLSNAQFSNQPWEGIVALHVLAKDVNLDLTHDNFWLDRSAPNRYEYKQGWS